jgi:hypothetical protein
MKRKNKIIIYVVVSFIFMLSCLIVSAHVYGLKGEYRPLSWHEIKNSYLWFAIACSLIFAITIPIIFDFKNNKEKKDE